MGCEFILVLGKSGLGFAPASGDALYWVELQESVPLSNRFAGQLAQLTKLIPLSA
jgi:hypothetical protein